MVGLYMDSQLPSVKVDRSKVVRLETESRAPHPASAVHAKVQSGMQVTPGDALLDPWLTRHCWATDREDNVCQVFDHAPRNCSSGF